MPVDPEGKVVLSVQALGGFVNRLVEMVGFRTNQMCF